MKNGLIEFMDGTKKWFLKDMLHREDGPAVEQADGTKMWYQNGVRHRLDGPAVEWANGTKVWWVYGKQHRDDGPYMIREDGLKKWSINGEKLNKAEVKLVKKILSGKKFKDLPLYVNHPKLKYFCEKALK